MQLIEVTGPALEKRFLKVPVYIYADEPNWIRPLDKDITEVFNRRKNKAFRHGEAVRWILTSGGKDVGRIAAFVNKKYKNKGDEVPVGGIGFFECINDKSAAHTLLLAAQDWLAQRGMQAMDGPINFGERDRWWGMVKEGFQEPLYCMNYNKPYYNELFEAFGFRLFFEQHCFGMNPKEDMTPKLISRQAAYEADPAFEVKRIEKSNLEKYAADFAHVYNKAWAGHGGLKQMNPKQAVQLFRSMKPVMDDQIVFFAYHNQQPIAAFLNLPDLNQWFKYLHGSFSLWSKLRFLFIKKTKRNKKFVGIVFGVVPEYQGKGIDSFIVAQASKVVKTLPYTEYEMQWIGDFNPKMLNVAQSLGDVFLSRKLITYRYLFNREVPFKRHPIIT